MSGPKNVSEFADRGPLFILALVMIPTLLITVPIGLVLRCLWDGLTHGWSWGERNE